MKKRYTIILVLCTAIIYSCKKNEGGINDPRWHENVYTLTGTKLHLDSQIMKIGRLSLIDDYLFISQYAGNYCYSVSKIVDDSVVLKSMLINRGVGPNEVNGAYIFSVPKQNSLIAIGYNPPGKIITMPYSDIDDILSEGKWHISNEQILLSSINITPLDTNRYLLQQLMGDNDMFAIYDRNNNVIKKIDYQYPDKNKDIPLHEKASYIYNLKISKRQGADQFVFSSSNGHFMQIATLENDSIKNITSVFNELPQYRTDASGTVSVNNSCKYGLSIISSRNYIYISDPKITGTTRESDIKKNGYPAGYTNEIYVCDWGGIPKAKYILDYPVAYIVVDSDDQYLYADTFNNETLDEEIVRFKLPTLK